MAILHSPQMNSHITAPLLSKDLSNGADEFYPKSVRLIAAMFVHIFHTGRDFLA